MPWYNLSVMAWLCKAMLCLLLPSKSAADVHAGRKEAWMTRHISADALQQHASNLQSEDAYSRRQLLEHEMHQQCCNLQHALQLSSEHL